MGSLALPAPERRSSARPELVRRSIAADPALAANDRPDDARRCGRAAARRRPAPAGRPQRAAPDACSSCAVSDRALRAARRRGAETGWRTRERTLDGADPLRLIGRPARRRTSTSLLVGRRRSARRRRAAPARRAGRDRRRGRRPPPGADRDPRRRDGRPARPDRGRRRRATAARSSSDRRRRPAIRPGPPLRELLDEIRGGPDDPRRAAGRAARALADVLDRRIELIEIGFDGGLRATASPGDRRQRAAADASRSSPTPASSRPTPTTRRSTASWPGRRCSLDRHRLRDRLRELRLWPWAGIAGDGARLRLAAARAALAILVEATPEQSALPAPDLVVVAGGAFAVAPGPAVALAVADVLRRPGAIALAQDHARLLGTLGVIPDATERRQALIDLVDDLLTPLGSVVIPGGIRAGASAGRLTVHAGTGASRHRPRAGRPRARRPAAGRGRDRRVPVPRRGPARDPRPAVRDRRLAAGSAACSSTCATCPLRLPERMDRRRELLDGVAGVAVADARPMTATERSARASAGPGTAAARRPTSCAASTSSRAGRSSPVRSRSCSALAPGDRALVAAGDAIVAGTTIAERLRDPRLVELPRRRPATSARAGERWMTAGQPGVRLRRGRRRRGGRAPLRARRPLGAGGGRARRAGRVPACRRRPRRPARHRHPGPGPGPGAAAASRRSATRRAAACRSAASGATSATGRLRSTSLDVGLAGTILVIGSRVDAEALTRARAMGVRGVIVSGLAGKERRDFLASEARQRAALHRLPPFAVLVLDGAIRRPIAGPWPRSSRGWPGSTVAIIGRSAGARLRRARPSTVDPPPADHVRVRSGEHAGEEGRWAGLAGRPPVRGRHVPRGRLGRLRRRAAACSVPIADLERFA